MSAIRFPYLLDITLESLYKKLRELGGLFFTFRDVGVLFEDMQKYVYVEYEFPARITKFRVTDVIITADTIELVLSFRRLFKNIKRFEIYIERPEDNIYPTLGIRADRRLEIPRRLNIKYRIREQVERGRAFFPLVLRLILVPESKEMTAYVSYKSGMLGGEGKDREYKVVMWFPVTFMYIDEDDLRNSLKQVYGEEVIQYWYDVFCWFKEARLPRYYIDLGYTNREKDRIFPDREYEKVRALVLSLDRRTVYYDMVGYKRDISLAIQFGVRKGEEIRHCGWDALRTDLRYPECRYSIFLDLDDFILIKYGFYTIEDYIEKHLLPTLQKYNIKGTIYVYLSSKRFLQYNYHIVVKANLTLEQWLQIDSELIEHDVRKIFHRLQNFSVLRLDEKAGCAPELVKVIELY